MICRIWRGWTMPANADAYESVVRGEVIPGIEAMGIDGFQHIDLMRRELGDEVEFVTLMWFDDIESVKAFVGDDYVFDFEARKDEGTHEKYPLRFEH